MLQLGKPRCARAYKGKDPKESIMIQRVEGSFLPPGYKIPCRSNFPTQCEDQDHSRSGANNFPIPLGQGLRAYQNSMNTALK